MQYLFEYGDMLNAPYEAFVLDTSKGGTSINSHWHYYTEIVYLLEGSIMVESDSESHVLYEGDLVLFYPKSIHSIYSISPKPATYVVLKFDINVLSISNSYTPRFASILQSARSQKQMNILFRALELTQLNARELMLSCVKEMAEQDYGYDIKLHSLLCDLMVYLIRYWRKQGFQTNFTPVSSSDEQNINNITEYIDAHSDEPLLVEDLAKQCHMSYSYFAKNFRMLYGKSCKEYIEFVKVCKADGMLLFTDCTLNYISQETGFTDCSHFIKTYKKIKGITPKQRRLSYARMHK